MREDYRLLGAVRAVDRSDEFTDRYACTLVFFKDLSSAEFFMTLIRLATTKSGLRSLSLPTRNLVRMRLFLLTIACARRNALVQLST